MSPSPRKSKSPVTTASKKERNAAEKEAIMKAIAKHGDKDPFDMPIKQYFADADKKPKSTTLNKVMKGLKLALIVNTASGCGHTKKHFTEMQALHEKYKKKGFSVLAFPSPTFNQESKDNGDISAWAQETYGATFPIFERVHVNGPATHPIFAKLKNLATKEGVPLLKWNFDKFLVPGNLEGVIDYSTAKKKPVDYSQEIEIHLK